MHGERNQKGVNFMRSTDWKAEGVGFWVLEMIYILTLVVTWVRTFLKSHCTTKLRVCTRHF